MFTRLLAILLATFYLLLATPVFAASTTPASGVAPLSASPPASSLPTSNLQPQYPASSFQLPTSISPTSPLYTDLLIHNMFHSFSCLAIGQSVIGQPCLTYQMTKNAQGMLQGVPVLSQTNLQGGALGATTSLIGALYTNPPVRTADYLASVGNGLGIVKSANAQVVGSGAAVLNPILRLWQVSRNISYVIMIIIFVVIGLMVMFRNKLNPQTVITAQAALPGLVIGLIMITFSYFLAGLISDIAFIGTNVVGYYFVAAQDKLDDPAFQDQRNLTQTLSSNNILSIFAPLTGIVTRDRAESAFQDIFPQMGDAQTTVRIVIFWFSSQFLTPFFSGITTGPWGMVLGPLLGALGGITTNIALPLIAGYFLSFAAALALIYQMVRLLIRLIMAYLTIIFLTISAPFQLLFASLPGRQGIATGWILNMLGNILIFPAVVAVIYFVAFLLGPDLREHCPNKDRDRCLFKVATNNQPGNGSFIVPAYAQTGSGRGIVDTTTFPLLGGFDLSFIRILLAFGALMALPVIPDIIVKTVGKAGQAGQMIGQEIMSGARQGQGYTQRTYGAGISWGQNLKPGLLGETGGPVWNPEAIPILDPRTGNPTGRYKGSIVYPRRPGLLRK